MRRIEFNHHLPDPVPFPYYSDDGEVQKDLLGFLLCRYYHYSRLINFKEIHSLNSVTPTTIRQVAHRVAFLLNRLEENQDSEGNPEPIHYLEATYQHIAQLIQHLYENESWKGESLVNYVSSWRLFYEFLTLENISHNLVFPDKILNHRKVDKDDYFLSHTSSFSPLETVEIESAVPWRYRVQVDDYKDSIISMNDWFKLYNALNEDDVVYATMAATIMQTFLRIAGILQFPLSPTEMNPHWKRYIEMERNSDEFQYLYYISKGQKVKRCQVHLCTMKLIHSDYIDSVYDERFKLYQENYVKSKHAKKQQRSSGQRFTWLNKNGTPVSRRELQAAFQRASEKIGVSVHPHSLRHTGATHLLYTWAEKKRIEITEANATDIHLWLKYQLGHENIKTTLYYIRTIMRLRSERLVSELLPLALPKSLNHIPQSARDAYKRVMQAHV